MSEENAMTSGDENAEAVKDSQNVDPATGQDGKDNGGKIEQLQSQMLEMNERLQKQSALIGKQANEIKSQQSSAAETPAAKEKTGEVSKYQELEEKIDLLQRRSKQQENAAKLSDIELALVEAGASPQIAKEQADYFAFKLGDRIIVEESDAGEVKRSIVDTDGVTNVPVSQWAKAYIESDAGSYLRAAKTGPSVKNNGTAPGQAQKVKLKSGAYSKGYSEAQANGKDAAEAFAATHSIG